MADTTIRVSEELAEELYQRKGRSTSYEEYLWEVLEKVDQYENRSMTNDTAEADSLEDTVESVTNDGRTDAEAKGEVYEELEERTDTTRPIEDESRSQLREELDGSGDLLDARVEALLKMYDYLREHGSAKKEDLLNVVDVDATGYASRGSVWSNMIKGKDTLRALPGVEKPASGRSEWTYTGTNDE